MLGAMDPRGKRVVSLSCALSATCLGYEAASLLSTCVCGVAGIALHARSGPFLPLRACREAPNLFGPA